MGEILVTVDYKIKRQKVKITGWSSESSKLTREELYANNMFFIFEESNDELLLVNTNFHSFPDSFLKTNLKNIENLFKLPNQLNNGGYIIFLIIYLLISFYYSFIFYSILYKLKKNGVKITTYWIFPIKLIKKDFSNKFKKDKEIYPLIKKFKVGSFIMLISSLIFFAILLSLFL